MDVSLGRCELSELRKRLSAKWTRYPPEVLPAWVAETDFDLARPIERALDRAVRLGDTGYANPDRLGEAFASFARERWHWMPEPGSVFPLPDVMSGIGEIISTVTSAGAGVVVNPPVYPPFFARIGLAGRRAVQAPLRSTPEGRYDLDFDAIEGALAGEGVEAYLLCNPHNPVGRAWSTADLLRVADLCRRSGVWLLVDEIHSPLVLEGSRHVTLPSLDHEIADRLIVFHSASKGWNVPGLKCALAVAGSVGAAKILESRAHLLWPSHFGVLATEAAFSESGAWLDALRLQLDENRGLLARLLAEHLPGVGYVPPEAGFLAWLDCRRLGMGDDPAAGFLERGRVALSRGPDFGAEGRGFARLNVGTSPALIEEAVRRMASAVSPSG